MPWIVGIDEAGYGPNLGPLVMTSVACQVPRKLMKANLWEVLQAVVRRQASEDDGRLLIEDSKLVYSPPRGLETLETGVCAALALWQHGEQVSLRHFLAHLCPSALDEVQAEPWYSGTGLLPVVADRTRCLTGAARFADCCRAHGIRWGLVRSVIVCPRRFNALLDRWQSKGAVLGRGLAELVPYNLERTAGAEPVQFLVDKHGGRNHYACLLQEACPAGFLVARAEGRERSVYQVLGLKRPVQVVVQPRADAEYFCVALASMVSKYVRELLMLEFNRFWQGHVSGLEATAGYPGDAARFFADIAGAATRLGIPGAAIWRRK